MENPNSDTIAFHAARLLILIKECGTHIGGPSNELSGVKGRTLLAKLDFFLRYPIYLAQAAEIRNKSVTLEQLGISSFQELDNVESRMVRYRYGPWDHIYYVTLAYMVGKNLITIEHQGRTEFFQLTSRGNEIVKQLSTDPSYLALTQRARLTHRIFTKSSGNKIKQFIYENFPDVVGRQIGKPI